MENLLGSRLKRLPGPILITGHTGFKGTWLTLLLEELGIEVAGISLSPTSNSLFERLKRTDVIREDYIDIRDFESLRKAIKEVKPSAIFHLAAQPLVLESYKYPRETFEVNVQGSVNLLQSAIEVSSIEAIVVATTDKVYKNENFGRRFVESDPLEGKDPYSASKVATESAVQAWQKISENMDGPKIISVRAGNVIGGGDLAENRIIPDLIRGIISGNSVNIRSPQSTRPWQHVLDPISGYIKAMEYMLNGGLSRHFNFGPIEKSLTVENVVNIFNSEFPDLLKVIYQDKKSNLILESIELDLDSTLASKELNWYPRMDQKIAITRTCHWWKTVFSGPTLSTGSY